MQDGLKLLLRIHNVIYRTLIGVTDCVPPDYSAILGRQ